VDTRVKKRPRMTWFRVEWWLPALITVFLLLLWEWQVRRGGLSSLFFPAPSTIIITLKKLLANGEMANNLGTTLFRVLAGFSLGGLPGLILGLSMGWSQKLRSIIDPFVAAAHPMPKIAILPLILIIFGIGELSKVIAIAVAAFFPMLINTMAGVRQISPIYFEVAQNYGANKIKVFTRVVLPGSLFMVFTGVRLALNISLLISIAVELVIAKKGLGAMIWFAWETLQTEVLYASLFMIAVLGVFLNFSLQRIGFHFIPWYEEQQS
jgi:ABC-type nitrate/sulfonate/bicarbonate transport system permease component